MRAWGCAALVIAFGACGSHDVSPPPRSQPPIPVQPLLASVGPQPRAFARFVLGEAFFSGATSAEVEKAVSPVGKTLADCGIDVGKLTLQVAIGEPLRVAANIDGPIDSIRVTCFLGEVVVSKLTTKGIVITDRTGGIAVDYLSDRAGSYPASPTAGELASRCAGTSCLAAALGPIAKPLWVQAEYAKDSMRATLRGPELGNGASTFATALSERAKTTSDLQWLTARVDQGALVIEIPKAIVPTQAFGLLDLIEFFRIPSVSMAPTLLLGDYMLVVKGPLARDLTPGDVIAHRVEGRVYVKRYIAAAGHSISESEAGIAIDGKALSRETVTPEYEYFDDPKQDGSLVTAKGSIVREHIGARSYLTLKTATFAHAGPWSAPTGTVFVLGDNRNNSNDSRYQGAVSTDDVIGRVVGIAFSLRAGVPDWNRIGTRVE